MNNNKQFTRRILLLGILPIVVALAILTAGFTYIQNEQMRSIESQLFSSIKRTIKQHSATTLPPISILKSVSKQLLDLDPIIHVALIDQSYTIIKEFGLPLNNPIRAKTNSNNTVRFSILNRSYISIPILNPNAPQTWVLVGTREDATLKFQYQGYLILMLAAFVALSITTGLALNLRLSLLGPINKIVHDLQLIITKQSNQPLASQASTIYNELIITLNLLIHAQHSAKSEMQNHIEQSTKELRESLETFEIQNIELDIAHKEALQASQAKSEFLANTSHELRTPLNGMLGFTSLLLKTGLTNQQKDYLDTIELSAQGLLTVINDILDFSKLETGKLYLEYKPVRVRELIEEVFAIYAPQAHEKNIRLHSIINHNLPYNLLGDPQRLKQVITNLVSNAIKFSTHGNIIIRVNNIGAMDSQIELKFNISDNGIGLTEEQQAHLFSGFSQADNTENRVHGGTGLGLAIAKGLTEKMNGEIGVDSTQNKGSTFWFTIRLGLDTKKPSQHPLTNSLYGTNILIYDPTVSGRIETAHLLANWGVKLTEEMTFNNIQISLDNAKESNPISLVILDAYCDANTFDKEKLVEQVQEINDKFKIPTIILAPPRVQRSLQLDIAHINTSLLSRPIMHTQLHQTICNHLNTSHSLQPHKIQPVSTITPNRGIKILVVDDNAANRRLVCELLKHLGVKSKTSENGYDAVETCKQESFDLILMDVQMPGMSGMETTRELRKQEAEVRTPIVALTAHAVNEQKIQLLLSGMDDYLSKPVSEADLQHIIDRWITLKPTTTLKKEQPQSPPAPNNKETEEKTPPLHSDIKTIFNLSESLSLSKQLPDLAIDMLNFLLDSLDETSLSLTKALSESDMDTLLEITHKFHGGCCYCGVPALRYASKELEVELKKPDSNNITDLTSNLLKEIERLKGWADEHDIDTLFSEA